MKVRSSVKPICEKCKIIKRKGSIRAVSYTHLDVYKRQSVSRSVRQQNHRDRKENRISGERTGAVTHQERGRCV